MITVSKASEKSSEVMAMNIAIRLNDIELTLVTAISVEQ